MRKYLCFVLCALLILLSSQAFAATKEDVIAALKRTYEVGDSSFRLPDTIINKAERYLKSHPLSEEKYDGILSSIDSAVAIAEKNGTTDITKIKREDIREGLSLMIEAAETANVDINKELSSDTINTIVNSGKETTSDAEKKPDNDKTQKEPKEENTPKNEETLDNTEVNVENTPSPTPSSDQLVDKLINNLSNSNSDSSKGKKSGNIDETIKRNLTFIVLGLTGIILLLIFIFYLIFKSRWYKIIKYILMVILVLVILIALTALIVFLINLEEIRMIYKLYYIYNIF